MCDAKAGSPYSSSLKTDDPFVRDLVVALGERWWQAMLQGRKRFEVRRRWVRERADGQRCWIYSGGRVVGSFAASPAIAMGVSAVAELKGTAMTPEEAGAYARGLRGGELTVIGVEDCRPLAAGEVGRAMPPRVDWRALPDLPRAERSRVLGAFRFLGFTGAGDAPRPALRRWAAEPGARPALMRDALVRGYAAVLALADAGAPASRMREEIAKTGVSGATVKKAVRFFLAAAGFAGLRLPPEWTRSRTSRTIARDAAIAEAWAGGETQALIADRFGLSAQRIHQILAAAGVAGGGRPAPPRRPARPQEPRGHERTVDLGAAGTVTLRVDADLVKLGRGDREWLFGLLDRFASPPSARPPLSVRRTAA